MTELLNNSTNTADTAENDFQHSLPELDQSNFPQKSSNGDFELISAHEYYKLAYKDKLSRTKFYYEYIRGNKISALNCKENSTLKMSKGKYCIMVKDPDLIEKIRMRRKVSKVMKKHIKAFVVKIPSKIEVEFDTTISSPMSYSYREFLEFVKSEKTKSIIKEKSEKYIKRKVTLTEEHYEIISKYAEELNMEIPEIIPILIKLFYENRE